MSANVSIHRAKAREREAVVAILEGYCEEIGVVVRDRPEDLDKYFTDDAGIWLAEERQGDGTTTVAGCVVLRPLPALDRACEVKRLYVKRAYRGARLADQLMEALHTYAGAHGYRWVYLDTKDDLAAAIKLYRRLGYEPCERYNDNPQATIFMRRALGGASP